MLPVRGDAAFAKHDDFPRIDIADERCPQSLECTALRGDGIYAIWRLPIAEWPESVGVSRTDELLGRHEDQRVGPFQRIHSPAQRLLYGRRREALPRHDVGDGLGIARAVENGARQLERHSQLRCVRQVAVVGKCHAPLLVVDLYGLAVGAAVGACRPVAHVRDGHRRGRKGLQFPLAKHLADKA